MSKIKPMLQIALDTLTVEEAIEAVEPIREYIDVVEVGTILLASQGAKAIKLLKQAFPEKIIVADGKIADAGKIFSKIFFEAGADYLTCICAAETATIKDCLEFSKNYSQKSDIQVELTSHFTWEQAQEWLEAGVKQVVYHRARDAQAAGRGWSDADIAAIKRLLDFGFKVTVTGGLTVSDIAFFKDLEIFIFVGGRVLRDSANPEQVARDFKREIAKYW